MSRAIERLCGNKDNSSNDFTDIYRLSVQAIDVGIHSRNHPYHLVSVANVGASGFPEMRTVVLRYHDSEAREVAFHADRRSPKINDLNINNKISFLMYDPEAKVQLRLKGHATIHHKDQFADKQWENTRQSSKYSYLNAAGSGVAVADRRSCDVDMQAMSMQADALDSVAYEQFAVVKCVYFIMDYTRLSPLGNERAILQWDEKGRMEGTWVVV